ncbi:hypothetical protein ACFL1U_03100 [Patescibacteria group bacterium]
MFITPFHSQTIPGKVHQEARLETKNAKAAVYFDHEDKEIIYETEGLVVALFGGTYLVNGPGEEERITEFAEMIKNAGGIIMNGALGGSMELSAKTAPDNTLGITTPIFHAAENKYGVKAAVDSLVTRRALLTYAPIAVAVPGSLGTFNEIIATLLELREQANLGAFAPHYVFVHEWWRKYLNELMKSDLIDDDIEIRFRFFKEVSEIKQVLEL